MLGNGIGMGLGPLAGGFLRDVTGDFASAVVLSSALSLVGLVSFLLLPPLSPLDPRLGALPTARGQPAGSVVSTLVKDGRRRLFTWTWSRIPRLGVRQRLEPVTKLTAGITEL